MAAVPYFGTYGQFRTSTKDEVAVLMNADSLVGDPLDLAAVREDGKTVVRVNNRFGGRIGTLDAETAHEVQLAWAKDWKVCALLASVWQTDTGEAGVWGEVVIIAFPQSKAGIFDGFTRGIADLLQDGTRPEVNLAQSSVEQIIAHKGAWMPTGRKSALSAEGSVLVKDRLSLNDKMIEAARKRNPGCMAAGWLFIAALVVGVLYVGKLLLGL